MGDSELRDLERRVLKGDESALFDLRVAYWRAGPPERAIPGAGLRLAQGAPLIRQKPTPDTLAGDVFSVRALNAIWRSTGVVNPRASTLAWIAAATSTEGLKQQKLVGPTTLAEIKDVLALAGLALPETPAPAAPSGPACLGCGVSPFYNHTRDCFERTRAREARYAIGDRVFSLRHGHGVVRLVERDAVYGWVYRLELDSGMSTGGRVTEDTLRLA